MDVILDIRYGRAEPLCEPCRGPPHPSRPCGGPWCPLQLPTASFPRGFVHIRKQWGGASIRFPVALGNRGPLCRRAWGSALSCLQQENPTWGQRSGKSRCGGGADSGALVKAAFMLPRPGVSRDRASRKGIPYLLYRPQVIRQDLRPAGRSPGYPQHLPILSSSSPPGNGFVELPPTAWCPVLCSRLCANGHETGRVSLGEHGGTVSHTDLGLCYGMVWATEQQDGYQSALAADHPQTQGYTAKYSVPRSCRRSAARGSRTACFWLYLHRLGPDCRPARIAPRVCPGEVGAAATRACSPLPLSRVPEPRPPASAR